MTRWLLPDPPPSGELDAFASTVRIRRPAARVLWQRGIRDPQTAARFLRPSLEDLADPYRLRDMDRAVARLQAAIAANEHILLYGDYDVDGTTSVVILKKAIEMAGGHASFHVPHRLKDGYGMRSDVIEQASRDGVSLIVSVDTGIRANEVVRRARELGIDVIVTDHHLPEAELPPAVAVLNPNRPDCEYPDKNLCGAGVAFRLVQALLGSLGWPADKLRRVSDSFLKLVAVATVADVVPLTGENRVIVKRGLDGFRSVKNIGLRALLAVSGFAEGDCPSAGQVAFRIAPRMNAAGRMATANDVIELFLTHDDARARVLADQLHALNQERQQAEADIVRQILEECSRTPVGEDQAALVFSGDGWHRGVVGIVASRLVDRFHRPAFVLSEDREKGEAQGSGRSIPRFHLLEALESMPDLFTRFGGHRQAAGLTLALDRVAEFRERFNRYGAARLTRDDFQPTLEIDAPLDFREITDGAIADILSLAPFGFGNPAPVFAACDVEVVGEPALLKEKHLRLRIRQNDRNLVVKAWNFAERAVDLQHGARVDVAISFEEDAYSAGRGYPGWAAVLREVRPATQAAAQ